MTTDSLVFDFKSKMSNSNMITNPILDANLKRINSLVPELVASPLRPKTSAKTL